jgi:hypothetical protein
LERRKEDRAGGRAWVACKRESEPARSQSTFTFLALWMSTDAWGGFHDPTQAEGAWGPRLAWYQARPLGWSDGRPAGMGECFVFCGEHVHVHVTCTGCTCTCACACDMHRLHMHMCMCCAYHVVHVHVCMLHVVGHCGVGPLLARHGFYRARSCMPDWHVLEWLQESFLTRGTITYSWIARKRSLGFRS